MKALRVRHPFICKSDGVFLRGAGLNAGSLKVFLKIKQFAAEADGYIFGLVPEVGEWNEAQTKVYRALSLFFIIQHLNPFVFCSYAPYCI